jgi:hypothetical protein
MSARRGRIGGAERDGKSLDFGHVGSIPTAPTILLRASQDKS